VITGNASDNVIDAGSGNDRVNGGGGNDTFIGGLGDDRYDGGTGTDVLDYSSATRAIAVDDGDVTGMGSDRYSNVEKIIGSKFADTFQGGKNVDTFDGGAGNDWFRGYEGSDIFTGGAGSDTFVWEEKDVVSGKKSQGVDTITDFSAGDRLDLSDITDGFNPVTLVKVTDTAAGSMVSVKVGSAFYDVVLLQSVHGITATSLLADGQLIA
jgi:serralysin